MYTGNRIEGSNPSLTAILKTESPALRGFRVSADRKAYLGRKLASGLCKRAPDLAPSCMVFGIRCLQDAWHKSPLECGLLRFWGLGQSQEDW